MALIFTDVDGTLLDHAGHFAVPDAAWREVLLQHRVILASSRDVGELRLLQQQLGLSGPVIAEDGAVVVRADGGVIILGEARSSLVERVTAASGRDAAALLDQEPEAASGRLASILLPVSVCSTPAALSLIDAGVALTPGGRWATVTAGSDKGKAASLVARDLGCTEWTAVGNAANDRELLAGATRRFAIRNPEGHDPVLAALPGVTLIQVHGPRGWPEAMPRD